jgi:hypothetical protein
MKIMTFIFIALMTGARFAVAQPEADSRSKVRQELENFRVSMDHKLRQVDRDIEKMEREAAQQKNDFNQSMDVKLSEVKRLRKEVAEDLEKMSDSTKEHYRLLKKEAEKKYNELASKAKKAAE